MKNSNQYSKTVLLKFAEEARKYPEAILPDLFDLFVDSKKDLDIFNQVLDASCELCNISFEEVKSGRRYGNIPFCRQLTSRILSEMGYSETLIAKSLPALGKRGAIISQIQTSKNDEATNPSYAGVLTELRKRFNLNNDK